MKKRLSGILTGGLSLSALLLGGLTSMATIGGGEPQKAESGRVERSVVYSPQLGDSVVIDTWLPEGFNPEGNVRYNVIYAHDGQNLFDATTTWNGQSWEIDRTLSRLIDSGKVPPTIVVGIHSDAATRVADLMPQKAIDGPALAAIIDQVKLHGRPVRGDAYAAFMTETLKPRVDSIYPTLPDMDHTAVMGSSMGGLMSVYALCEYPDTYGTALCLSTHWIGGRGAEEEFCDAMCRYLIDRLPVADGRHRLYFDHGTATLDASYGPYHDRVMDVVRGKGYRPDTREFVTRVFPGDAHEENSWARRVQIPLLFFAGEVY